MSYGGKCAQLDSGRNQPSRTDLPSFVEGLEIEIGCPVLIGLTHECIQKLLEVGNRRY